jgi:peptidoglycan-associated lipoprotein
MPLHKINVISCGEGKPVAPNTTREGRAQNRRVVVRVLS